MEIGIVVGESIVIGAMLSAVLTVLTVASLKINKEMWLQDYPPDVKPIFDTLKKDVFAL